MKLIGTLICNNFSEKELYLACQEAVKRYLTKYGKILGDLNHEDAIDLISHAFAHFVSTNNYIFDTSTLEIKYEYDASVIEFTKEKASAEMTDTLIAIMYAALLHVDFKIAEANKLNLIKEAKEYAILYHENDGICYVKKAPSIVL